MDIFQKIKALGYSGVSFYVDWALLEGDPGNFTAEGIFDLGPFFDAASEAGIYLLARPGPYINAEASGGGFPGWLARDKAILRTNETGYERATDNYAAHIGAIIADAQITNGGPVILLQPENEYTSAASNVLFPDVHYFEYVEQQFRNAGIVVPLISNDAAPDGYFAPGKPGAVDIYGHDSYPLGFDCEYSNSGDDRLLTVQVRTHMIGLPVIYQQISIPFILNRVQALHILLSSFKVVHSILGKFHALLRHREGIKTVQGRCHV